MFTEHKDFQEKIHCITIEDLVPQDHLLRKLEAMIDFSFIYDEVREYYCADNGRPSIDPVVLVKFLLLGYLYGILSERKIAEECQDRNSFRWFLGLDIGERFPDHSTISQLRRRKFNGTNLFRKLFERVLALCIEKGLVDGKVILTDSTHVKANASRKSEYTISAQKEVAWYEERLDQYEALEREELEQAGRIKPKQERSITRESEPVQIEKTISATDPEAGFLQRPGKPQGMHDLDHQSVDAKNGMIVDVAVTPGNVTDATPYLERIKYMREHIGFEMETACADSAYDVSLVHQELLRQGIRLIAPVNKEIPNDKVELRKSDFIYNKDEDIFICPQGKSLSLRRLQRSESNIYREYRASREDCKCCPIRGKCLSASQSCRRIQVNIFENVVRENHKGNGTPEHKAVLALRQIWCEGRFAAQKARHNLKSVYMSL